MDSPAAAIVVMGVAGCGKTTVGTLLAQRLGVPYLEADDFHPPANVAKMRAGTPLTDEDRQPWLAAIARQVAAGTGPRPVVSCSALKRQYRSLLRQADPRAWFLHLVISEAAASQRVAARPGHFMPESLVPSQLADLEPLQAEAGLTVDATRPPEDIITAAIRQLAAAQATPGNGQGSPPGACFIGGPWRNRPAVRRKPGPTMFLEPLPQ